MRVICGWALILAAWLLTGCVYTVRTTPLQEPVERVLKEPYTWSSLSENGTASLGDLLFWLQRYQKGAREDVVISPPVGFPPVLASTHWAQTHTYASDDGKKYAVYSSDEYQTGSFGIIVDENLMPATEEPFVQLKGAKQGRQWSLQPAHQNRRAPIFFLPQSLIEAWGVRYGGRMGANYVIEIVDGSGVTVSQIRQSLHIPPEEFFKGFTVKGVFIRGVADVGGGKIQYALRDDRVDR